MSDENVVVVVEPMQSTSIGKLAEALAKAQGEISAAHKEAVNPFFSSKYADLTSVWDACRKPLAKNGLAVIQTTKECDNAILLVTNLVHSSGEWICGYLKIKPEKGTPQGMGSAMTYARRYALAAIVGVTATDDDGEGATDREQNKTPAPATTQKAQPPTPDGVAHPADTGQAPATSKKTVITNEYMKDERIAIWDYLLSYAGGNEEEAINALVLLTAFNDFTGYKDINRVSDKVMKAGRLLKKAQEAADTGKIIPF